MKKLSFFALAAVGLLFGACSSDKDVADGGASPLNGNGDGYLGVAISIPSAQASTRANDNFVNGKAEEFAVKNAWLYLFKGTSEANATYMRRYSISQSPVADTQGALDSPTPQDGVTFVEDGDGHTGTGVTSTAFAVCKIDKPDLGTNNLYAYVVINAQGGLANAPAVGTPFSEFAVKQLNASDTGGTLEGVISPTDGLLMTNSPISDKPAGGAAPVDETLTTLVKLEKSYIMNTSAEALLNPAGCIYVERAAAKVTVAFTTSATSLSDVKDDAGEEIAMDLSATGIGWQIINTEPKFYNTRQLVQTWDPLTSQYMAAGNTKYRFISKYDFAPTIPAEQSHTTGYRTYFAKDIQYNADATLEHTVAGETGRNWLGTTDCAYVPENTFDVDRQQRKNTTQVTLRVKFNGGVDFCTVSNDAKFYLATDIDNVIASKVSGLYKFSKFLNDYVAYQVEQLHAANTSKYYKVTVTPTAEITDKSTASDNAAYTVGYTYTITESDAVDGTYTASSATPVALSAALGSDWTAAKDEAESDLTVALYKGGLSYYNIRIQHFGEIETPWDPARGVQPGETIEQIYGPTSTRTADYLGRYGVVRDNWYNLSIDGITKLGNAEPKPVNGDPTPDDEIEEAHYISAHVHILPWVLRTQSVSF